jgi:hypothetical protein
MENEMTLDEFRRCFLLSDGNYDKGTPPCVFCDEPLFNLCRQDATECSSFEHYVKTKTFHLDGKL